MPQKQTIGYLVEIAIQLERATEALYLGLEEKFSFHQEVARFWRRFASEEAGHARWLERLQEKLEPAQASAPADPELLNQALKMLQLSQLTQLEKVNNFDDAYELALDLENSETNAVFDFLIGNFAEDEAAIAFLRVQLQGHIANITDALPDGLRTPRERKKVLVL